MPSVDFSVDPITWLRYVKSIYNKLPIELQLVWLYEILVKTCLLQNRDSFKKDQTSYYIATAKFNTLVAYSTEEISAINQLYLFRNRYVHFSYYNITEVWKNCVRVQKVLNTIAQRYGVSLNWSKTVALEMM